MTLKNIDYILFDAASTLIYKPALWPAMASVLEKYGYNVPVDRLQLHHKILSEAADFPDRTSKEFYADFNAEFLLSFGIIPTENLLSDFFLACSYLPWERFEDTEWLDKCRVPIGVLSNFNNSLIGILDSLFGNIFSDVIISEAQKIRKPDLAFFNKSLEAIKIPPSKILYVGDSLKLDMMPARNIGYTTVLIDRLDIYRQFKDRIVSLRGLEKMVL